MGWVAAAGKREHSDQPDNQPKSPRHAPKDSRRSNRQATLSEDLWTSVRSKIMGRWTDIADIRTVDFAGFRLTYVPDGWVHLKSRGWYPGTTDADWAPFQEMLDDEQRVVASVGGLLVEKDGRTMLIDAGFGVVDRPDMPELDFLGAAKGGALLDSLKTLGKTPDDIECVAITHIHPDHIGWAGPAFADSTLVFDETEWANRAEAPHVEPAAVTAMEPYARTVKPGEEFFPGVRAMATPGHTPGHAAYVIGDDSERLIMFGDALHSPVQVSRPEWVVATDADQQQAVDSRKKLLDELQRPGTAAFGIHFSDVQFGRVRAGQWVPGL